MSHYEERLANDLDRINSGVRNLAALVERGLKDSMHALLDGDAQLANFTVLRDNRINRASREIDRLCHAFIARHLPGAGHLRLISAVIRLNVALERIGDYAVTISRESLQLSSPPSGRLARELGLPIEGPHEEDRFLLDSLPQWCRQVGFPACESFLPTRWLREGDEVSIGNQLLRVHHCPGHTPGHVIFFHPLDRVAIVGDVIFQGSVGRTDFPRGDHETLLNSIRERIWPLGDEVTLLPGHGPTTTVGEERAYNPFLQGSYG